MGTIKKSQVCLIIPAYNEGRVIRSVVEGMHRALKSHKITADIVVVNDGSVDNTAAQAASGGAKVINHVLNSGAGGATATGLSYANQHGYYVAATMDGDGQHAPEDVIACIESLRKQHADLLIGSRLIDSRGMSPVKVLGNQGLSFVTYALFGVKSTDSQSGLRVYSRRALESLRWKTSGYEFCSEMIWRAKQIGLSIAEHPIQAIYSDYSKGKGQSNWNAINILKSLVKRRVVEMFE